MGEGDLDEVYRVECGRAVMEIPGFGWISIPLGQTMDVEGEDHRAGLAGGSSPHEPREQPMTTERTDLGPCAVCGIHVYDQDGAAFSPLGEIVHPDPSWCYTHAWGPSPLTEQNTRTAQMLGRLVALGTKTPGGTRRHIEVMLWLRNLTPDDRQPPDGVVIEWNTDAARVALIPEFAIVRVDELDDGRWLPLDEAPGRIEEWSNLLPLEASRALLATFLMVVRDTAAAETKSRTS